MYRPSFHVTKPRINYEKTWALITRFLKDPAPIRPEPAPAHLAAQLDPAVRLKTVRVPQLRGNVTSTLTQIVHIFLAEWRQAARPINLAIRTTRASLAKRCHNKDPKTAYRHILALIAHGFLRAKVQVKGGLQLLLNPDLLVFDASPATAAPSAASPALTAALVGESLFAVAQKFAREFAPKSTPKAPPAFFKSSMRA